MASSTTQGDSSPSRPALPTSLGHSELTSKGERALLHLEQTAIHGRDFSTDGISAIKQGIASVQLGPANVLNPLGHHLVEKSASDSNTRSVSSGKSSRFGFRKQIVALFKPGHKAEEATFSPSAPPEPARFGHCTHSASNDEPIVTLAVDPTSPTGNIQFATTATSVPTLQIQENSITSGLFRQDVFHKNVDRPTLRVQLPKPRARIEQTTELVYACSVLITARSTLTNSDTDGALNNVLEESQRAWIQLIDTMDQRYFQSLLEGLVRAFTNDTRKGSAAVVEIVLLGPVLDRETYRSLLSCFINTFENITTLDVILVQALAQLVQCASSGYLVDDDLVRIATVLSKKLDIIHKGTSEHPMLLTMALSRVLDVMVAGKVMNLNRNRDHQPMLKLLDGLKGGEDPYLKYQAAYAYQALQYAPDDETPLQALWRYTQLAAAGASAVASVMKMDAPGLLAGLASIHEIGSNLIKAGVEGVQGLRESGSKAFKASENKFNVLKKRSWYLALQGTALFISQGRLSDFHQVVCQAPCRHDVNFQWGICRQVGEIAVDPLWEAGVRSQAVVFLGELYRSSSDWKPHADTKRWILTLLVQISALEDLSIKDLAVTLLDELKADGTRAFSGAFSLSARLPLPNSFPLLDQVEEIIAVERDIHKLKMRRIEQFKPAVYIAPMAKPNPNAPDDNVFFLLDKVEEFMAGNRQVMLIQGDSGAGKSMFNYYLEHRLWLRYNYGDRIPLFVNLPALHQPEKNLVGEHLESSNFSEVQINELKLYHRLLLICDGYDESHLRVNLHTTNAFIQAGHRDVKLLITCRTQYLGPEYRHRFAPKTGDRYHPTPADLFQEAVITPFSKDQIELYVEKYISLEPRKWAKDDYMERLTAISDLMELVKNPFLLTLALEALPGVDDDQINLSRLRVIRLELYDTFVTYWLRVNKRRLLDQMLLKDDMLKALEELLDDGFERNGKLFQKNLAAAIFREQEGRPVVDYSNMRDETSWKGAFFKPDPRLTLLRESSLLSRAGNQFRFVHRSVLEYFFSCAVWDSTRSDSEIAPQAYLNSISKDLSMGDHPMSRDLENAIIQFLSERVVAHPPFKQHLLALVELSKSDTQALQAGFNAKRVLDQVARLMTRSNESMPFNKFTFDSMTVTSDTVHQQDLSAQMAHMIRLEEELHAKQEELKQLQIDAKTKQDKLNAMQAELDANQDEARELQIQALGQLAVLQARIKAVLTQTHELHEYPVPRLFVVLPQNPSKWDRAKLFSNKFRLYFLCECGEHSRSISSKAKVHHIHIAKHDGYEIARPSEFFRQYGSYVFAILKMLKFGISVAGVAVPAISHLVRADDINQASTQLQKLQDDIEPGMDQVIALMDGVSVDEGAAIEGFDGDMENKMPLEGADLRKLDTFLKAKDGDKVLGNLYRTVTDEGYVKWVCIDHYRENYQESTANDFQRMLDAVGGSFDKILGRVEVTLRSRVLAEQFFSALGKARSVHELDIIFDWACTTSDLEQLEVALKKSRVSILRLDIRQFRTSNLLSTPAQYGVLLRIKGLPNMRIFLVVLSKDVARFLSIRPKTASRVCKLSIEQTQGSVGAKEIANIAEVLKTNSTLTSLDLRANSIGDNGAKALAEALKTNSTLTTLNLRYNSIGDSGGQALVEALMTNSTLTTLDLAHNSIGDNGGQALGEALKTNSTLTTLDLSGNSIGVHGGQALGETLKTNSTLTTLDLSGNSIGVNGGQALGEALKTNSTLTILNLRATSIGDNGAKALGEALKTNSTLTILNLRATSIGDNGAKALAEALKTNSTLTTLDLQNNKIGDDGAKALVEALKTNSTLPTLDLRSNSIGSDGAKALAE
ncbi:hypothetical protein BGZ68_007479 [Mortierella alpina]|nr:hypothetical protein BGZ68_007479 [Mortierella alpina]